MRSTFQRGWLRRRRLATPSLAVVPPSVPDRDCGEGSEPPPQGCPPAGGQTALARSRGEAHDEVGARPLRPSRLSPLPGRSSFLAVAPLLARMADDELEALRRITKRHQRAEDEWRDEVRRLFEAGHGIEEIAAAAGVRYDVVLAIVRPS